MDERPSRPRADSGARRPPLVAQPPDHLPPRTLTDEQLGAAIARLRRKLHSARRSLRVAHTAGITLTIAVLGAGFTLLVAGPAPFFERFLGNGYQTTTFDAVAWWLMILLLAIAGATLGDQLLRGKLRLARGWKRRVKDLEERLDEAEAERRSRAGA